MRNSDDPAAILVALLTGASAGCAFVLAGWILELALEGMK